MEHKITDCENCPLYYYNIDSEDFKTISICKHPKSEVKKIERHYKPGGIFPKTPTNCPLKNDNLILIKE